MPDRSITTAWQRWERSTRRLAGWFDAALANPADTQSRYLRRILRHAEGTAWAETYGIDGGSSIDAFRSRVPVIGPEELATWTERIRHGERNVLTRKPVERLVPTSGTTRHNKLIPMTADSRREYARAVDLWIRECLRQCPAIKQGRAYIATSPAIDSHAASDRLVPVGFAPDGAYLSPAARSEIETLLAVPTGVSALREEAWRDATRQRLLDAEDLSFLSLWHAGYLEALFTDSECRTLSRRWTRLGLISCWADGATAPAAECLRARFPGVPLQPKGLWLTEGAVSVPWRGHHPLALGSGFFDFALEDGDLRLAHKLEDGMIAQPVLTNVAGLYRYRLGDVVRVDGFVGATPSIRWIGRADQVSDLVGEKLSEAQVADALARVGWDRFFLLLPKPDTRPAGYACLLDAKHADAFPREAFIHELSKNPHYQWATTVGQIAPPTVHPLHPSTRDRILQRLRTDRPYHTKAGYLIPRHQVEAVTIWVYPPADSPKAKGIAN